MSAYQDERRIKEAGGGKGGTGEERGEWRGEKEVWGAEREVWAEVGEDS